MYLARCFWRLVQMTQACAMGCKTIAHGECERRAAAAARCGRRTYSMDPGRSLSGRGAAIDLARTRGCIFDHSFFLAAASPTGPAMGLPSPDRIDWCEDE